MSDSATCQRRRPPEALRRAPSLEAAAPTRDYPQPTARLRRSENVDVNCELCAVSFRLSIRRASEHRRRGTSPRCRTCRHPNEGPSREAVEAAKAWWLERYSLSELANWPPL